MTPERMPDLKMDKIGNFTQKLLNVTQAERFSNVLYVQLGFR
jgi:hypothetical protein